jgi:nitroreductase
MRAWSKLGAHLIGQLKPVRVKQPSEAVLELPRPRGERSPFMTLLAKRQSQREFSPEALSPEVLSDLLWAAFGINRPETGGRTAPSAMNAQEIDVYAALPGGVYRYHPKSHALHRVAEVDARRVTGYQDFVDDAPLDLIYVADGSQARHLPGWQDDVFGATCAGAVSQNVYLFCAEQGLNTVVRAWFDRDALVNTLGLGPNERVLLTQTVGYPPAPAAAGQTTHSK